jgi:glyoxylase-like metal-dependent hydrolase (beta-lactamase superfamily II)
MKPFSVFSITSPLGSNVYFVNTSPAVIIDAGHPYFARETLQIMQHSLPLEKVGFILCTHSHPDHLGAADLLRDLTSAKLWILPIEKNNKLTPLHKRDIKLDMEETRFDNFLKKDERIDLNDDLIETIYTPGHSDDHCCFYFSQRKFLFTGDLIAHDDTGFLNLNKPFQESLDELNKSIDRCAQIETRRVFSGHGNPYRIAPWSKLKRKLQLFEKNPLLLISHTLISPFLFYLWAQGKVSRKDGEQYIADHAYLFDGFLEEISVDLILNEFRKLLSLLEIRNVISCEKDVFSLRFSRNMHSQWFR